MQIELPKGMSEKDVKNFLAYIEAHPLNLDTTPDSRVHHNCDDCRFGPDCGCLSLNCKTAVFNQKEPPTWLPKEK